jgi:TQXA domain-containing protein
MQKPTSTNGRRIAAAMLLGAASTAMVAGTAHADGVTKAKVHDGYRDAGTVDMNDDPGANTALIGLDVPGSSDPLWTYCIQQTVELKTHETYDEHAWSDARDRTGIDPQHLEAIKWILNNSFPQITDLGRLASANQLKGSLTPVEAVEATQAAIWTFADTTGHTALSGNERDAQVVALYTALVNAAKGHMSETDQPQASLTITANGAAHAGAKVPFTLGSNTSGSFISVALSDPQKTGAKLVDAKGDAIAANARFAKGDVVYVQLPSSVPHGSVTLTASGTVSGIEAGRVFLSDDGKPSQNLILAQSQSTPVSASAEVTWTPAVTTPTTPTTTTPTSSPSTAPSSHPSTTTPSTTPSTTPTSPTGGLAHTGAGDTVPLAGGALALVAAGGGMMVYTRRRKQGSHS